MKNSLIHKKHLPGFFFLPHVKEEEAWSEKSASSEANGRNATDGRQARTSLPQLQSAHASARGCHAVGAPSFAPASTIQHIKKTAGMIKFPLLSILLL